MLCDWNYFPTLQNPKYKKKLIIVEIKVTSFSDIFDLNKTMRVTLFLLKLVHTLWSAQMFGSAVFRCSYTLCICQHCTKREAGEEYPPQGLCKAGLGHRVWLARDRQQGTGGERRSTAYVVLCGGAFLIKPLPVIEMCETCDVCYSLSFHRPGYHK